MTNTADDMALAFSHALAAEDLSSYETYLPSLVHTLKRFFDAGFALGLMRGGEVVLEAVRVPECREGIAVPWDEEEGQSQFIGKVLTNGILPEVSDGGCQG